MQDVRTRLAKRRWDFQRFGISPKGLFLRLGLGGVDPVVSISIPKAGTHLTESILCRHPLYYRRLTRTMWGEESRRLEKHLKRARPGQILCTHSYFSDERLDIIKRAGARMILTVRDPRDILLSDAHYLYSNRSHPLHERFRMMDNVDDRAMLLIQGDQSAGIIPFPELLRNFSGWLATDAIVLHYEDLVSSSLSRAEVVGDMFRRLGAPVDGRELRRISANAVSRTSPTFRRGRIGEWRAELGADVLSALQASAADQIALFGHTASEGFEPPS
jgi:hypothetical protein